MIHRLIFISSVILLSFPFVGVPSEWMRWVAFGLGVLFFIYSVYSGTRHIAEKEKKSAEEQSAKE